MPTVEKPVPVRAITSGAHHFFGYYDKHAFDATGRYHLALRVGFCDRMPTPDDAATVGMVDLRDGDRFIALDQTTAWCWQQGCMLQWLGCGAASPGCAQAGEPVPHTTREIIYSVCVGGAFRARVRDVQSGATRDLPRPIYSVTPDGRLAATLNFSRLNWCRPGYGYDGPPDPNRDDPAPDDDGVWAMDLRTGESRLLVSIADLAARGPAGAFRGALCAPHPSFPETTHHWVNHLLWNTDGSRLVFLHRWRAGKRRFTRMYTVGPDGRDLFRIPADDMVSHFCWRDETHLFAWARRRDEGDHFYLFEDRTSRFEIIGADVMTSDGHCSYSPDGRWILNDTYPHGDPPRRGLYLYRVSDDTRFDLGLFDIDRRFPASEMRTDLHPRWGRDMRQVSFDSAHEGMRQVYVADVSEVIDGGGRG